MDNHLLKIGSKSLKIRNEVLEERIVSHPWTLCSITGIIAVMELLIFIRSLFTSSFSSGYGTAYKILYCVLFLASASAAIFLATTAKKSKSMKKTYYLLATIYVFVICFFTTGISYLDLVGTLGHPIVFITTFLAIPCICLINPWIYSLLTVFCSTVLLSFVSYVGPNTIMVSQGLLINFIIFNIITIFIAFQAYDFVADYYDKSTDLRKLGYTDTLTGLRNRRSFDDEVTVEKNLHLAKSMVLADIDSFKKINDEHGHQYGDKVLSCVGALLRESFGVDNSFRYGGDEMAISTNKNKGEIIAAIDYINAELQRIFPNDHISMSFGICLYEEGMEEVALINNADKALYLSKKTKEKKYSFYER